MLSKYGKLSCAIIAYYTPALPVAVWICIRHGFGRHAGWFYLLSLSVVRIVGASLRIAADFHLSKGLFIGASILSSVGLAPLLLAFMGMIKRVNDGKEFGSLRVPPRLFQLTHAVTLVGLIMGIIAGVDSSSNSAKEQNNAKTDRKVGAILFLVSVILSSGMAVFLASRVRKVIPGDRIIAHCLLSAMPFLFVRVAYTMLVAFDTSVNPLEPNIWEESFMQVLMEMVVYTLFLIAGVRAPPSSATDHPYGRGIELAPGKYTPRHANRGQEQGIVGEQRR